MTYPQPSGASYVINNQNAFRLTTRVVGPGDIYESDASGLAVAVGPLSDIANIGVTYLDEQRTPALVNSLVISPERSYIGRLDARMDVEYPFSLRPGRVLFSLVDLYDPNFRPTGFDDEEDGIEFLDPVLDVIQYFQPAPSIIPARSDKELYLRYLDVPVGAIGWLMVPAWGRKYGHITYFNANTVTPVNVSVIGVRFSMTDVPDAHYQETLLAPVAVAAGATAELVWNAADQGAFDMLGYGVTNDPHGLVAELVIAGFVTMKHAATARVYADHRSPRPLTVDVAAVKWRVDWFKVLERFQYHNHPSYDAAVNRMSEIVGELQEKQSAGVVMLSPGPIVTGPIVHGKPGMTPHGAVVVLPDLRPSWLPVIEHAAAVITEEDGATAHLANVGRERSLPIIRWPGALKIWHRDGDFVTVDVENHRVEDVREDPYDDQDDDGI